MNAVETIANVLASNVIKRSLAFVPARGATLNEIAAAERDLGRPLSDAHRRLLQQWNGLNLDVIRFFGASATPGEVRSLHEVQTPWLKGTLCTVAFADDPAGFMYGERDSGEIVAWDRTSDEIKLVAADFDDFINRLVFGADCDRFAGADWKRALVDAGLLE